MHQCLPMAFHETVRGLAARGGVHDVQSLGGEVALDDVAKQLGVAVTSKTLRKPACLSTEEVEGGFDLLFCQRLQREDPVVACSAVDEHQDAVRAHLRSKTTRGREKRDRREQGGA